MKCYIDDAVANIDEFNEKLKNNINMLNNGKSIKLTKQKIIPQVLFDTIANTHIDDRSIKFRGFVAVFDIMSKDFPIYDIKVLQTVCSNFGFHVIYLDL